MINFKSNLKWAIMFLLLIVICLSVLLMHKTFYAKAPTAQIIQDGKVIHTIDLTKVNKSYELEINAVSGGTNIVRVEHGKIGMIRASCPDKICINQGFIHDGTFPIACLPNRLSILIKNTDNELDAVTGGISK